MKIIAIAALLTLSTGWVHGHPPPKRALGGSVVVRKFATGSDIFVDTAVVIDVNEDKTLHSLNLLSHPQAIQMISTTSDASYVTCDYTCGHRGAMNGNAVVCGSTTMKSGAPSNILDASWVDSVEGATCFVSANDPTE
ncbi:hypothetical protein FOPE_12588 [Fonsecaea pedrosoi]|nr:hypothetical protein FOPE_12588 [Fonsecaea pedrosoi]